MRMHYDYDDFEEEYQDDYVPNSTAATQYTWLDLYRQSTESHLSWCMGPHPCTVRIPEYIFEQFPGWSLVRVYCKNTDRN